jgi:hypothetical protein
MVKENHNHAVGIVTDPILGAHLGAISSNPQQSTVLSDDVLQSVIDTTEAEALAENTQLLLELTTLLHSNPVRLGGQISYSLAFQKLPKAPK